MEEMSESPLTQSKKLKLFPWIQTINRKFSKLFPGDYDLETLNLFQGEVEKEMEIIFISSSKKNEALFSTLMGFYNHFCWKIKWKEDSPHMKSCCTKLLSSLSKIGLVLSEGNVKSKWLNQVLSALKVFPGDNDSLYSALLHICKLKKKYQSAYGVVLRQILCHSQHRTDDPSTYFKLMLLFRRLKFLLTNSLERVEIDSLASRVAAPLSTISWLMFHNLGGLAEIKLERMGHQLMRKKLGRAVLEELREVILPGMYSQKFVLKDDKEGSTSISDQFFLDFGPEVVNREIKESENIDNVPKESSTSSKKKKSKKMLSANSNEMETEQLNLEENINLNKETKKQLAKSKRKSEIGIEESADFNVSKKQKKMGLVNELNEKKTSSKHMLKVKEKFAKNEAYQQSFVECIDLVESSDAMPSPSYSDFASKLNSNTPSNSHKKTKKEISENVVIENLNNQTNLSVFAYETESSSLKKSKKKKRKTLNVSQEEVHPQDIATNQSNFNEKDSVCIESIKKSKKKKRKTLNVSQEEVYSKVIIENLSKCNKNYSVYLQSIGTQTTSSCYSIPDHVSSTSKKNKEKKTSSLGPNDYQLSESFEENNTSEGDGLLYNDNTPTTKRLSAFKKYLKEKAEESIATEEESNLSVQSANKNLLEKSYKVDKKRTSIKANKRNSQQKVAADAVENDEVDKVPEINISTPGKPSKRDKFKHPTVVTPSKEELVSDHSKDTSININSLNVEISHTANECDKTETAKNLGDLNKEANFNPNNTAEHPSSAMDLIDETEIPNTQIISKFHSSSIVVESDLESSSIEGNRKLDAEKHIAESNAVESISKLEEMYTVDETIDETEVKCIVEAEPIELVTKTRAVEIVDETEDAKSIAESKAVESIDETEAAETIDEAEAAETIDEAEAAETIDETEAAETIDETEAVETIDETEAAETIDKTEVLESIADTKTVKPISKTEAVENISEMEAIENIDETETVENISEMEAIENIDQTEAVENINNTDEPVAEIKAESIAETQEVENIAETQEVDNIVETQEVENIVETQELGNIAETEAVEKVANTEAVKSIAETETVEDISKVETDKSIEKEVKSIAETEAIESISDMEAVQTIEETVATELIVETTFDESEVESINSVADSGVEECIEDSSKLSESDIKNIPKDYNPVLVGCSPVDIHNSKGESTVVIQDITDKYSSTQADNVTCATQDSIEISDIETNPGEGISVQDDSIPDNNHEPEVVIDFENEKMSEKHKICLSKVSKYPLEKCINQFNSEVKGIFYHDDSNKSARESLSPSKKEEIIEPLVKCVSPENKMSTEDTNEELNVIENNSNLKIIDENKDISSLSSEINLKCNSDVNEGSTSENNIQNQNMGTSQLTEADYCKILLKEVSEDKFEKYSEVEITNDSEITPCSESRNNISNTPSTTVNIASSVDESQVLVDKESSTRNDVSNISADIVTDNGVSSKEMETVESVAEGLYRKILKAKEERTSHKSCVSGKNAADILTENTVNYVIKKVIGKVECTDNVAKDPSFDCSKTSKKNIKFTPDRSQLLKLGNLSNLKPFGFPNENSECLSFEDVLQDNVCDSTQIGDSLSDGQSPARKKNFYPYRNLLAVEVPDDKSESNFSDYVASDKLDETINASEETICVSDESTSSDSDDETNNASESPSCSIEDVTEEMSSDNSELKENTQFDTTIDDSIKPKGSKENRKKINVHTSPNTSSSSPKGSANVEASDEMAERSRCELISLVQTVKVPVINLGSRCDDASFINEREDGAEDFSNDRDFVSDKSKNKISSSENAENKYDAEVSMQKQSPAINETSLHNRESKDTESGVSSEKLASNNVGTVTTRKLRQRNVSASETSKSETVIQNQKTPEKLRHTRLRRKPATQTATESSTSAPSCRSSKIIKKDINKKLRNEFNELRLDSPKSKKRNPIALEAGVDMEDISADSECSVVPSKVEKRTTRSSHSRAKPELDYCELSDEVENEEACSNKEESLKENSNVERRTKRSVPSKITKYFSSKTKPDLTPVTENEVEDASSVALSAEYLTKKKRSTRSTSVASDKGDSSKSKSELEIININEEETDTKAPSGQVKSAKDSGRIVRRSTRASSVASEKGASSELKLSDKPIEEESDGENADAQSTVSEESFKENTTIEEDKDDAKPKTAKSSSKAYNLRSKRTLIRPSKLNILKKTEDNHP